MRQTIRRLVLALGLCLLSAQVCPAKVKHHRKHVAVKKTADPVKCLATAIYYEAGGQSPEGQKAVANVILNRSEKWSLSVCQVVWQKVDGRRQFTFQKRKFDAKAYNRSLELARTVWKNRESFTDNTGGSTYFHATRLRPKPRWTRHLIRTVRIQGHQFYREKS